MSENISIHLFMPALVVIDYLESAPEWFRCSFVNASHPPSSMEKMG